MRFCYFTYHLLHLWVGALEQAQPLAKITGFMVVSTLKGFALIYYRDKDVRGQLVMIADKCGDIFLQLAWVAEVQRIQLVCFFYKDAIRCSPFLP